MPSPFPGMDPYLEGRLWPDVHTSLATAMRQRLAPLVRPRYTVRLGVYVAEDSMPEAEVGIMYPDVEVLLGATSLVGEGAGPSRDPSGGSAAVRHAGSVDDPSPLSGRGAAGDGRDPRCGGRHARDGDRDPVADQQDRRGPDDLPTQAPAAASGRCPSDRDRLHPARDAARGPPAHPARPVSGGAHAWSGRDDADLADPYSRTACPVCRSRCGPPTRMSSWIFRRPWRPVYETAMYDLSIDYRALPPPPVLSDDDARWVADLLGWRR